MALRSPQMSSFCWLLPMIAMTALKMAMRRSDLLGIFGDY